MNIAVRYYSRSGNTRAVAIAAADAVHADALPVEEPLPQNTTDLLLLGGAMYAFHIARPLRDFIRSLSPEKVRAVAVFSTASNPGGASKAIAKECRKAGLRVLPVEFHCVGKVAKKPETAAAAAQFAQNAEAAAAALE